MANYTNIGKYPIFIKGVGTVAPGENFDCDAHKWDKQRNIRLTETMGEARKKPTRASLLKIKSISGLRDKLAPFEIVGRNRTVLLTNAFKEFGYDPLKKDE